MHIISLPILESNFYDYIYEKRVMLKPQNIWERMILIMMDNQHLWYWKPMIRIEI